MRRLFSLSETPKKAGSRKNGKVLRKGLLLITASFLIACAAVVYVVQAYSKNPDREVTDFEPTAKISAAKPSPVPAVRRGPESEIIETEIVTVLPHGFDPPEITRTEGPFFLSIDNMTGLEELSLRLRDSSSTNLMQTSMTQDKIDWDDLQNLPAGVYTLTESSHPEWLCTITIVK